MGKSSVIVCFDVRSEKFSFINLDKDMERYDPFCNGYACGYLTLFNYKGKLGIRQNTRKDNIPLVLWVIEDAQRYKWFKQAYELPPLIRRKWFVGMTGAGEIVWYWPCCFYLYNLERETCTRVNIQGFEELEHRRTTHIFVDYVENLKLM
ncbi:unnamed protein product [Microthlaspi erraticum]|uniref:F-box associated beta-propeller type 3 domain-containing protein n=1 Tax=Microthlaspi erraticum TaxID=1685480 RepID=A0A6D2JM65_9BRAS|nr:unnamed protein product [Microthlaspi erraticum]